MELEKKIIIKDMEKGRAFSQITLEDDQIVPDSKPDVAKVIHTWGEVRFEEPKISSQALWVNGRLDFSVLYRSEEGENKLEKLEGTIPFQEKLSIDGLDEGDHIRLQGRVEDLASAIINSRKLAIRGVVDILAVAGNQQQQEIATGLQNEEGLQIRRSSRTMLDLAYSQKDMLRVRKELTLPSSKPNIEKLLFYCVNVVNPVGSLEAGALVVRGEMRVCILYYGGDEEELTCYEVSEPFEGKVDSRLTDVSGISWITVETGPVSLEVREDYDGELRTLALELDFDIQARMWQEETVQVMSDLYALDRMINPIRMQETLQRLLIRNQTKVRLAESFAIEREQEKIMQICCFSGEVNVESSALEDEGLMVEGTLCVHVLYMTSDEFLPVSHMRVYLPFEQLVELPEAEGRVRFEMSAGVEQLQVNLLDPLKFEVKALIGLDVIAFEECLYQGITAIEETPLDREELRKQPGLVGYTVQEGQKLWDIAKTYHTTEERIRETNELTEEALKPGQKLMIVKMV